MRCEEVMGDEQVVTLYVKVHLHNILEIDDEGQQFMADVSVVRVQHVLRSYLSYMRGVLAIRTLALSADE